jgi:hypothetical protein
LWLIFSIFASSAFSADPMRLLGPVRFPRDPALAAKSAPEAAAILEKFRKAGYARAVWAVGALPSDTNAIAEWTKTCLAAFPEPPLLALDPTILAANPNDPRNVTIGGAPAYELDPSLDTHSGIKGVPAPAPASLLPEAGLKVFLPQVLPRVHSVMINYTHLNNLANAADPAPAIARAKRNAELTREAAKAAGQPVFLWLHLDDNHIALAGVKQWVEQLGPAVDGFALTRWHEWNAGREGEDAALAPVRKSGKPILRCGFHHVSPTMRPGLEQDLRKQYREHMKVYEDWVKTAGFAGYYREIGPFIPGDISSNMNLLAE